MVAEFATLVGLLCNFRQEIGARKDATHREFVEWLGAHHHDQLKELVARSHGLQIQIDELLRRNQHELLERLDSIANVLAAIVSKLDGMNGLVEAVLPNETLPEQAVMILRQLANSSSESLILGDSFFVFDSGQPVEFQESKFLAGDLDKLVSLTLLREGMTSQGDREFQITRNGVAYLKAIKAEGLQANS